MSLHDDLTAVQRCVDDLARAVGRLQPQLEDVAGGPDLRRVRADTAHLRESVALLRESAAGPDVPHRPDLVTIPDAPYDRSLWTDSDDEGLGARDRHAP
ncbi:hypothetical protein [Streptomyces sp. NPDC102360]|uniref:hypothetical protein n=1 Tax=Streptomyces sp. NPDC102360 TaxID=3366160 RepID=UPI003830FC3A